MTVTEEPYQVECDEDAVHTLDSVMKCVLV